MAFTHACESVLDALREGNLLMCEGMNGLFLASRDHIDYLLDLVVAGSNLDDEARQDGLALTSQLNACLGKSSRKRVPAEAETQVERKSNPHSSANAPGQNETWHISVRFGRDVMKTGMDPAPFLRYLATLGQIVHIDTLPDAMPEAEHMDPECCYLGFEIRFKTDANKARIEPGFSTADKVSNLSGRGVGMDVVRRNIEALRGSLEIQSQAGQGSMFRIRLPLTLAIIDGFLMAVGNGHYVVPLDTVLECVELKRSNLNGEEVDYLNLRGEVLPLLRISEHFDIEGGMSRRQNIVVVNVLGRKAGLVVDEFKGEFQAVIKPLGRLFEKLRGISGSTILGSGEVALVLDVPSLLDEATRTSTRRQLVRS